MVFYDIFNTAVDYIVQKNNCYMEGVMKVSYRIAGIKFTIEGDFEYSENDFDRLFHAEDDEPEDYHLKYIEVDGFPERTEDAEFLYSNERFDIYNYKGLEYRCFRFDAADGSRYGAVLVLDGNDAKFFYHKNYIIKKEGCTSTFIFNNQVFERILLNEGGVILHSSYILYKGRAILFSAPSGTGKSTQADLWKNHAGAVIVNGDRSILKKENGIWRVHGLPMCGSSKICQNVSAPLESVVLLSKLPENKLSVAKPGEALGRMYRECTVNAWNEGCVNKVMDMLTDLISEVKVYSYGCTKEPEAVEVLRKVIDADLP